MEGTRAGRTIGELGGCTRCGAPLAEPRGLSRIDKSFEPCAGCGAFVARRGANEWDLLRLGEKTGHVGVMGSGPC